MQNNFELYSKAKIEIVENCVNIISLTWTFEKPERWIFREQMSSSIIKVNIRSDYYPATDLKPFALNLLHFFVALFSVHNVRNSEALE